MGTPFKDIYNCFLGKVTDDMYMELTPQDTLRDLQSMLLMAIPGFEFPRVNLYDYTLRVENITPEELQPDDFVITEDEGVLQIDKSSFNIELTKEEINILGILMMGCWLQRQVTSIENIRMKYTGSDFKMTSQANHLSKLLNLQTEVRRDSHHMQRLYKRRKVTEDGKYESNWKIFREVSTLGHKNWY